VKLFAANSDSSKSRELIVLLSRIFPLSSQDSQSRTLREIHPGERRPPSTSPVKDVKRTGCRNATTTNRSNNGRNFTAERPVVEYRRVIYRPTNNYCSGSSRPKMSRSSSNGPSGIPGSKVGPRPFCGCQGERYTGGGPAGVSTRTSSAVTPSRLNRADARAIREVIKEICLRRKREGTPVTCVTARR